MDQAAVDRLMLLPDQSTKRRMIVECFGCYSLASVMLKVWAADEAEKEAIVARIMAILDDPSLD